MKGIRNSTSGSAALDLVAQAVDFGRELVRLASFGLAVCILAGGLLGGARAQDENEFVKECLVIGSQKMCGCMSSKVPAARRGVAIAGMRKSNALTRPGGPMLESSMLTSEEMQGLQEVVLAHASCMLVENGGAN